MKKLLALLLAIVLTLALCACGGSAKSSATAPAAAAPREEPAEAEMFAAADSAANYGGFALTEESAQGFSSNADAPDENPEKIIYSSDVTVETTDFETSISALAALVEEYDGWIQSSSVNGADYYSSARGYNANRSAHYTLRIPSSKFSQLMGSLSTLGNVPYSHTYTENVTSQYYDVQARLTAYTTQEARLLEMMELAETVSDVIIIEEKLTELRYEIESLQSSLNNWDRRVSYSTVNVSIEEVREYTPEDEMSYGEELLRSFVDGLKDVGRFFKNTLVNLVGLLPTLVVLAVVFVIFRPVFIKLRAKHKEKKGKKNGSES